MFEAVLRWVKHDTELRTECVSGLLSLVRMPLLTPQYLADHVATEPLIRSSHLCRSGRPPVRGSRGSVAVSRGGARRAGYSGGLP